MAYLSYWKITKQPNKTNVCVEEGGGVGRVRLKERGKCVRDPCKFGKQSGPLVLEQRMSLKDSGTDSSNLILEKVILMAQRPIRKQLLWSIWGRQD